MAKKKKAPASALHVAPGVESTPSINPRAKQPPRRKHLSVEAYVEGVRAGNRVVLSQAITLLESTRPDHQAIARQVLDRCLLPRGQSIRVGITGAPGVGKSTFIEALGAFLTARGRRLAVLTIDPSSTRTRGSILGDKTRMPLLAADPNAFIRPSPTAGSLGGVARTTRETIILCEAAGYDTVFVETVGAGQSEVAVHAMVDFFLLLVLAGAGDELQGIKRGIVEMADALVVTKADGANVEKAHEARREYRNALTLFPPKESKWWPSVLTCSAFSGEGIDEIWKMIEAYRAHTQENGFFEKQRQQQARNWMLHTIEHHLRVHFFAHPGVKKAMARIEKQVMAGKISSFTAAQKLLAIFRDAEEA
ncbi:MAG: methylmalonyl Co-A mutase-associated GTPase MeaB [Bacteroidetes bacterium]|nr:methylmalonyl Co-A mutase-associated GTPase MeaB [Bacteroidota bacterium]